MEDCSSKKKKLLNVNLAMICAKMVAMDQRKKIATTVNMPKLNKLSEMLEKSLKDELSFAKKIINVHKHIIWMNQIFASNVVQDAMQNLDALVLKNSSVHPFFVDNIDLKYYKDLEDVLHVLQSLSHVIMNRIQRIKVHFIVGCHPRFL